MARKLSDEAPAPIGHNTEPLTEAQEEALQTWYELNIRQAVTAVEAAMAVVKEKRNTVNGHFKRLTADLGHTRAAFEEYLDDLNLPVHEFLAKEAKRARLHRLGGLAKGEQQDLALGDTVDDQAAAEAAGRRAYRAGAEPIPPKEVSPILGNDWMRGWQDEQTKVAMQMQMAEDVIAARGKAADPEPEPEPEPEFDADKSARKLKKDAAFMSRKAPAEPVLEPAE